MNASIRPRRVRPALDLYQTQGAVLSVAGGGVTIADDLSALQMSARVEIETDEGPLLAEIAGLGEGYGLALPFGPLAGVRRGAAAKFLEPAATALPSPAWLGRVVDALGRPLDGKGPIAPGPEPRLLRASPPPAPQRARLGPPVDFGVKALNAFTPARAGQRLGVFSGSGVGKSALLGMIARNTESDVAVIALIGERGREVRDFIEDHLGEEGLAKSVLVVATADAPAMMRREAGYLSLCLAEYFRDQGAHVLYVLDSLTRIAMAQREIGLAAGEPPASRGYTPSVFSTLPAMVERAGPGLDGVAPGYVTGVFSVLVEGDDHDEPISDTARAILDGHIVLDRSIAERGRFPAVDVLKSVSRAAPADGQAALHKVAAQGRAHLAAYDEMKELIRIGAYRQGADSAVDHAIALRPALETFLTQAQSDRVSIDETTALLEAALSEGTAP